MTKDQERELETLREKLGMVADPGLAERQWNRALKIAADAMSGERQRTDAIPPAGRLSDFRVSLEDIKSGKV